MEATSIFNLIKLKIIDLEPGQVRLTLVAETIFKSFGQDHPLDGRERELFKIT